MPIFSLPSKYGIGTFGREAYRFVDFLVRAGQQYWQILPIGPTSYRDSPYQSFSTFAGNPYFIDPGFLEQDGLLLLQELEMTDFGSDEHIDYEKMFKKRFLLLKRAFLRGIVRDREKLAAFRRRHRAWIEDYALFMALKEHFEMKPWKEWDEDIRVRRPAALTEWQGKLSSEVDFWAYLQYLFSKQWTVLKRYANQKGLRIFGDLPIYVAEDSADAWAHPDIFWLDEQLNPVKVAGVPPDGFSATGQLWGNPLYRWDVLRARGYDWWVERVRASFMLYDTVRIDHFRGFDSYYAIPYGDKTAEHGVWMSGPGLELFEVLQEKLGKLDIVAEDLGYLTPSVRQLLEDTGYPGMKVLEFAFDSREESDYLPHRYGTNSVVYTGTHDNDTVNGWFKTASRRDVRFCNQYLRLNRREGSNWGFIKGAWASTGVLAIAQMQDFLGLGSEARINTPSTCEGNWQWRASPNAFSYRLAGEIRHITKIYGRLGGLHDGD